MKKIYVVVCSYVAQNGTPEEDRIYGIFIDDDDSVVLAGTTEGTWANVSRGDHDFAVVKLDQNGAELWRCLLYTSPSPRD